MKKTYKADLTIYWSNLPITYFSIFVFKSVFTISHYVISFYVYVPILPSKSWWTLVASGFFILLLQVISSLIFLHFFFFPQAIALVYKAKFLPTHFSASPLERGEIMQSIEWVHCCKLLPWHKTGTHYIYLYPIAKNICQFICASES